MLFFFLFLFVSTKALFKKQSSWEEFFPETPLKDYNISNEIVIMTIGPIVEQTFYINNCQFNSLIYITGGAIIYTTNEDITRFDSICFLIENSFFYNCAADTGGIGYIMLYMSQSLNKYFYLSKCCCSSNNARLANCFYITLTTTKTTECKLLESTFADNGDDMPESIALNAIAYTNLDTKANNYSHNIAQSLSVISYNSYSTSQTILFEYTSFSNNAASTDTIFSLLPFPGSIYLSYVYFEYCNLLLNKQSLTSGNGLIVDGLETRVKYCSFYHNIAQNLFTTGTYVCLIMIEKSFIDLSTISNVGLFVITDEYVSTSFMNEIKCLEAYICYANYDTFIPDPTPIRTIERTPEITTAAPTPQITTPSRSPTISKQPTTRPLPYLGFYSNDNADKGELKVGGVRLPVFAAIFVASFAVFVFIVFFVLYFIRRNSNNEDYDSVDEFNDDNEGDDENSYSYSDNLTSFDDTSSEI